MMAQEDAVKDLLNNYIEAVNNLPKTKSEIEVTQFFHENYKNYTAELGLSGVVNRKNSDLTDFSEQIQEIINNSNYTLTLSLEKILYVNQKNKVGTVSALVNFENKFENKIADKGTILLNLIASKVTGAWKIMHTNTTRISESKDVGRCSCYIYNKGADSNRYVSEVYYPAGLEVGQAYQSFRIAIKKGKRYIISDNSDFTWKEADGEIYEGETLIGKADDIKAAIKLILERDYTDNCIEMLMI
ncbi:MAG: hypothetical protein HRT68_00315 [Flavobacteriaceae bacterium]|nr:hypothetical protein [Flavobacteriaceae bacterium]